MTAVSEGVSQGTLTISATKMRSQLVGVCLEILKRTPGGKAWNLLSEPEQEAVITRVTAEVTDAIDQAVLAIAQGGRNGVTLTIDSLAVKDSIKLTCSLPYDDQSLQELGHRVKKIGLLVFINTDHHQDAVDVKPEPLQRSMELAEGGAADNSDQTPEHEQGAAAPEPVDVRGDEALPEVDPELATAAEPSA